MSGWVYIIVSKRPERGSVTPSVLVNRVTVTTLYKVTKSVSLTASIY